MNLAGADQIESSSDQKPIKRVVNFARCTIALEKISLFFRDIYIKESGSECHDVWGMI